MKRTLPRCGNYRLESYLPVFLWKLAMVKENKECFWELIELIKENPDVFANNSTQEVIIELSFEGGPLLTLGLVHLITHHIW